MGIFAAYGSTKDISVYSSIGLPPSHIYIVGRPTKKMQHQCQVNRTDTLYNILCYPSESSCGEFMVMNISSSSSRTATPPTCPSWSTTRGLGPPSPPAPAWSSARAASGSAPLEETSFANAITSFAPSPLSSPAGRGRPLPTSRGGLSEPWASARWSGTEGSGRQPRGAWASPQGAGAAAGAPRRVVAGYSARSKVQNGAVVLKDSAWATMISGERKKGGARGGGGWRGGCPGGVDWSGPEGIQRTKTIL